MTKALSKLNDVYLRGHYYDIVFNRDISAHTTFFLQVFNHFTGRAPQSILDIACGPGYHARALAHKGLRGVGLDLSEAMLNYGRQQSEQEGLNLEWVIADMTQFDLATPVDLAIIMFDGIDLLTSDTSAINHFRCISRNLTPGGLYIIEQIHPSESQIFNLGSFSWKGERDGVEVEFVWGVNNPVSDIVTGIAEVEMEMRINDHGQKSVITDRSLENTWSLREIRLITEHIVGDLKVVGYYGDYNLNQPLDWSAQSVKMITVIQKM